MSGPLPVVIINGLGRFGSNKLVERLIKSDLKVIGIGGYSDIGEGRDNFEWRMEVADVTERADYIVDFESSQQIIVKAREDGSKLVEVAVNNSVMIEESLKMSNVNWRIVNGHGVFGPGMDMEDGAMAEVGYLISAIKLAVSNKNLILPGNETLLRLLGVEDMTEVIIRSIFLSGTEKETFDIWGRQILPEELAKVLIDLAKMTRFKVSEGGSGALLPSDEVVVSNWKRLRWQPGGDFEKEMEETLQYFFVKADSENRREKSNSKPLVKTDFPIVEPTLERENKSKRFEVIIDEEIENHQVEVVAKKPAEIVVAKPIEEPEEMILEEEFEEIKPLIVKKMELTKPVVEEKTKVEEKLPELVKTEEKPARLDRLINYRKIAMWAVVFGSAITLMSTIKWSVENYLIVRNISVIKSSLMEKQYEELDKTLLSTSKLVASKEEWVENWGVNSFEWGRRYQNVLKSVRQGLLVTKEVEVVVKKMETVNQGIFLDKDVAWNSEMGEIKNSLGNLDGELGILQARLTGDWGWLPPRFKSILGELKRQLENSRKMVFLGTKMTEVLPEIIGADGKRREYMVLFQNENELRAGGGFVGSYGILSFEGGKLSNLEIKDVYEADGQLKGHVEPPEPIKNYLGEANWFMRDANWQADFMGQSKDIQWFLEKETGRKVDGVIGINLAVVKSMLGVVGEVYVPDFKEKINKNNLYEQAEFYTETKFFPGSNQKASFLGGLGKQLFEEIKNTNSEKRGLLLEAMIGMLESNDLQLAMNNKQVNQTIEELGWNGLLYEGRCPATNLGLGCFADYLYILESNLGVNKANYFLYRNVDETVEIGNNTLSRIVKITYENTAKNNNWPGGDYKNYLRLYIPNSANLAEVSVTDMKNSGIKTIYNNENLKVTRIGNKKEVALWVIVPVMSKVVVEARYNDQISLEGVEKFSYLNYIQRQPGFGDTGWVTLVSMPDGWQPNQVEPAAALVNGKLLFNQKLTKDIKMGVEIAK